MRSCSFGTGNAQILDAHKRDYCLGNNFLIYAEDKKIIPLVRKICPVLHPPFERRKFYENITAIYEKR